jgi:hypothetical protein
VLNAHNGFDIPTFACIGYSSSILIDSDVFVLVVRDASLFMTEGVGMAAKHACFGVCTAAIEIF